MKYKRSYNLIFAFVLVIIIVSCVLYSTLDFTKADSQGDSTIVDMIDKEQNQEIQESSTMKKVNFNNFATAYRYGFNYLAKSKGYKAYTYGNFTLNVKNLVNITQDIELMTDVNNVNKKSFTELQCYGTGKIKADIAWQFLTQNGMVRYRESRDKADEFSFVDKEIRENTVSEFLSQWACMPNEVFVGINNLTITNGSLIKNGSEYVLSFTVPDLEIIDKTVAFVKAFFGESKNAQKINPKFEKATVKMTLDTYGRPKVAQYTTNFYDLDLKGVGIPLSGLGGVISYTQKFYNYDQAVDVTQF